MKILVGIPMLYGYGHCKDAIESVLNQNNVDLLIIDNGSEHEIKQLIRSYCEDERVIVITNKENIYVNPAWNQIIEYFLIRSYDHVVIMNSDLLMQKDWAEVLRNRLTYSKAESLIPNTINDRRKVNNDVDIKNLSHIKASEGTAGIFITLSKEQAKMIYPIPSGLKVWYGDNWIYDILRILGHNTIIPDNLIAHHGVSQTIQHVKGIDEVIELDKMYWDDIVSILMEKKINEQRNKSQ